MNAVLFDLDGTLTDPREGITRCIAHALSCMGREAPPQHELHFAIGPPLRASFARLLDDDARDTVERAVMLYRERFADVGLFENTPYDGIAESLAELRAAGAKLFVATSKPVVYAVRIVRHFGLEAHFDAVHGCELDGTREDKRDLLAHLLPHHGLAPRGHRHGRGSRRRHGRGAPPWAPCARRVVGLRIARRAARGGCA